MSNLVLLWLPLSYEIGLILFLPSHFVYVLCGGKQSKNIIKDTEFQGCRHKAFHGVAHMHMERGSLMNAGSLSLCSFLIIIATNSECNRASHLLMTPFVLNCWSFSYLVKREEVKFPYSP